MSFIPMSVEEQLVKCIEAKFNIKEIIEESKKSPSTVPPSTALTGIKGFAEDIDIDGTTMEKADAKNIFEEITIPDGSSSRILNNKLKDDPSKSEKNPSLAKIVYHQFIYE